MVSGASDASGAATVEKVVLAAAAGLIALAAVATEAPSTEARALGWPAAGLVAAGVGSVMIAGRFPAAGALAALLVSFAWYGSGHEHGLINVVTLAAFFRLGASDRQGPKVAVVVAAAVGTASMMAGIGDEPWQETATAIGYVVMAALFGEFVRNRRLLIDDYARRAAHAEADADRRLAEERLVIARDVHDVLAHTVSVMTVQAAVAQDALERDLPRAAAALETLRAQGREAMEETRAIVAVLRSPAARQGASPVPGLSQLGDLTTSMQRDGLTIDVELDLPAGPLPELVELTAYRVVQEGLTNVARHAAGASVATVRVAGDHDRLLVEVRDDGRPRGGVAVGYGLRGMAERVEAIGGTLHHGFADGSGFLVRATLPTGRPTR